MHRNVHARFGRGTTANPFGRTCPTQSYQSSLCKNKENPANCWVFFKITHIVLDI